MSAKRSGGHTVGTGHAEDSVIIGRMQLTHRSDPHRPRPDTYYLEPSRAQVGCRSFGGMSFATAPNACQLCPVNAPSDEGRARETFERTTSGGAHTAAVSRGSRPLESRCECSTKRSYAKYFPLKASELSARRGLGHRSAYSNGVQTTDMNVLAGCRV